MTTVQALAMLTDAISDAEMCWRARDYEGQSRAQLPVAEAVATLATSVGREQANAVWAALILACARTRSDRSHLDAPGYTENFIRDLL